MSDATKKTPASPPAIDGVLVDEMDRATASQHEIEVSREIAKIESDLEFKDEAGEEWRRRAMSALAHKRFLRDRLGHRLRKLRAHEKFVAPTTEKAAEAKLAKAAAGIEKQQTLRAVAETAAAVKAEKTKTARMNVLMQHSSYREFYQIAKRHLDAATFSRLCNLAAAASGERAHAEMERLAENESP